MQIVGGSALNATAIVALPNLHLHFRWDYPRVGEVGTQPILLAPWLLPKLVGRELKPEPKNLARPVMFKISVDEMEHPVKYPYPSLNLLLDPDRFGVSLPALEQVSGPGE